MVVFQPMNSFTIRDMENLCGIKAHTLRIWEQRYQLHNPKRRAGNHRFYDNEDLKYLLRIAHLYHKGYKISALAKLSHPEICQLAQELLWSISERISNWKSCNIIAGKNR